MGLFGIVEWQWTKKKENPKSRVRILGDGEM